MGDDDVRKEQEMSESQGHDVMLNYDISEL